MGGCRIGLCSWSWRIGYFATGIRMATVKDREFKPLLPLPLPRSKVCCIRFRTRHSGTSPVFHAQNLPFLQPSRMVPCHLMEPWTLPLSKNHLNLGNLPWQLCLCSLWSSIPDGIRSNSNLDLLYGVLGSSSVSQVSKVPRPGSKFLPQLIASSAGSTRAVYQYQPASRAYKQVTNTHPGRRAAETASELIYLYPWTSEPFRISAKVFLMTRASSLVVGVSNH